MDFPRGRRSWKASQVLRRKEAGSVYNQWGTGSAYRGPVKYTKELPGGLELPPSAQSSGGSVSKSFSTGPQAYQLAKVNNSWAPGNGKCLRRSLNRWAVLGENSDPTGKRGRQLGIGSHQPLLHRAIPPDREGFSVGSCNLSQSACKCVNASGLVTHGNRKRILHSY